MRAVSPAYITINYQRVRSTNFEVRIIFRVPLP